VQENSVNVTEETDFQLSFITCNTLVRVGCVRVAVKELHWIGDVMVCKLNSVMEVVECLTLLHEILLK